MTEEEKASYLLRREGILDVLRSLIGDWELAEGLIALIGSEYVTPSMIDGIETILRDAIKAGTDDYTRGKLESGLTTLVSLKEKELEERKNEQNSLSTKVLEQFI